jgi:hypothetical protein
MESRFVPDRRKGERRGAPRNAESGAIEISFAAPVPITIEAELIETSTTGFRASHDSKALEPGLEVRYQSDRGSGNARVIWTHVLEGRRVSGFLILPAAVAKS